MNKARRSQLAAIHADLNALLARIEDVRSEEQDAFDNRPENFQESDAGQVVQDIIGELDSIVGSLEDAQSSFENLDSM